MYYEFFFERPIFRLNYKNFYKNRVIMMIEDTLKAMQLIEVMVNKLNV